MISDAAWISSSAMAASVTARVTPPVRAATSSISVPRNRLPGAITASAMAVPRSGARAENPAQIPASWSSIRARYAAAPWGRRRPGSRPPMVG